MDISIDINESPEVIDVDITDVINTGGSGGTTNYNALSNKPKINNVELSGNKSLNDLGITSAIGASVESYVEEHQSELKGDPGTDGTDGTDGISPVATVSQSAGGAIVTITDATGTTTATIANGVDGDDGNDGISPVATVTTIANGAKITITDANGTTSAEIHNGTNGTDGSDYVITSDDYDEIAIRVYDMFTDAESVSV